MQRKKKRKSLYSIFCHLLKDEMIFLNIGNGKAQMNEKAWHNTLEMRNDIFEGTGKKVCDDCNKQLPENIFFQKIPLQPRKYH